MERLCNSATGRISVENAMPYEYLEESVTSDVTFRAWGHDLNELFMAAADATTNVMVQPLDAVRPLRAIPVSVTADALDLLLLRFLEELIYRKDVEGLLLRAADVHVEHGASGAHATAELRGEPLDPARHDLRADVKAVTLYGLRVEPTPAGWEAEVTLDV